VVCVVQTKRDDLEAQVAKYKHELESLHDSLGDEDWAKVRGFAG
jgi:hypothetical protein